MWRKLTGRSSASSGDNGNRIDPALAAKALATANRGYELGHQGRWQAAAAVTAESVAMYRSAPRADAEAREKLAGCLVNLGQWLAQDGRFAEASDADVEAVEIYRELDGASPQIRHGLAAALNNASIHLSQANRWPEAVEIGRETVAHMRQLAEDDSGRFTRELASALANLGTRLDGFGLDQESLDVKREAIALYVTLVESDSSLRGDLAQAYTTLGPTAARLGRAEEAAEAAQDAVRQYRILAAADPTAHVEALAGNLANLALFLQSAGRHAEAYTAVDESIALHQAHPGLIRPDADRMRRLLSLRAKLGRS